MAFLLRMVRSPFFCYAVVILLMFTAGWMGQSVMNPNPLIRDLWQATAQGPRPRIGPGAKSTTQGKTAASQSGRAEAAAAAVRVAGDPVAALLRLEHPILALRALREMLQTATLDELPSLLTQLQGIKHPSVREEALGSLFSRWATLDPEAAYASVTAMGPYDQGLMKHVWSAWATKDFEGALAAARARGVDVTEHAEFFLSLAAHDPIAALERWEELGAGQFEWQSFNALKGIVLSGELKEPQRMLKALANVENADSSDLMQLFLTRWNEQDPGAALSAIQALPPGVQQAGLMLSYMNSLYATDPAKALSFIQSQTNPVLKDGLARELISKECESPLAALTKWKELHGGVLAPVGNWMGRVGTGNIADLSEFAAAFPGGPERTRALNDYILGDGYVNLSDRMQQLLASQPLAAMDPALQVLVGAAIKPENVGTYLDTVGALSPQDRQAAYSRLVKSQVKQWVSAEAMSPSAIAEQVATLDPRVQATAVTEFLRSNGPGRHQVKVPDQFANSADWAIDLSHRLPPAVQSQIAPELSLRISDHRPDQAAALLQTHPLADPEASAYLHEHIAAAWVKKDPLQASTWISQLPAGAARDAAVVALVQRIGSEDAEAAAQWASSLTDPVARLRAAEVVPIQPLTQPLSR